MSDTAKTPAPDRPRRRICFVIDRLAGRSGGAERIMIETANALAARGHEVQIVSHESRVADPFYPLAFGVMHTNLRRPQAVRNRIRRRVDRLRNSLHNRVRTATPPLDRLLWLSKYGSFWRRLEAYLVAHEPDVAIAFLPPAITALGLVSPPPGLRRIASLHNVPAQDLRNPERWDPSPLDRKRREGVLKDYDAITVLLPEFRDWFDTGMQRKISIMPNPVRPLRAKRIAQAKREKTILAVGRLAPVKAYDVLIDAWAKLAGDYPDWQVKIFGVGPSKKDLSEKIRALGLNDKLRLMGHTDNISEQYLSASILCHPATHEGWGLAVTEAMAAGLVPVGFADCTGVNQLIQNEQNGVLVDPGDDRARALADALAGLIESPERRTRLGAAGPSSMRDFAPGKVIDLWEDILYEDPRP